MIRPSSDSGANIAMRVPSSMRPALGARPRIQPLAVGQAAVHHGQAVRPQLRLQPRPQRAFELRRQIDFRDHQQHLTTGGQHALGGAGTSVLPLPVTPYTTGLEAIQGGQRFHRRLLRIVQRRRSA